MLFYWYLTISGRPPIHPSRFSLEAFHPDSDRHSAVTRFPRLVRPPSEMLLLRPFRPLVTSRPILEPGSPCVAMGTATLTLPHLPCFDAQLTLRSTECRRRLASHFVVVPDLYPCIFPYFRDVLF